MNKKHAPCGDCAVETVDDELYMVASAVWAAAQAAGAPCRFLCIECIERRLGRTLIPDDFTSAMVNFFPHQSARLQARLAGKVPTPESERRYRREMRTFVERLAISGSIRVGPARQSVLPRYLHHVMFGRPGTAVQLRESLRPYEALESPAAVLYEMALRIRLYAQYASPEEYLRAAGIPETPVPRDVARDFAAARRHERKLRRFLEEPDYAELTRIAGINQGED